MQDMASFALNAAGSIAPSGEKGLCGQQQGRGKESRRKKVVQQWRAMVEGDACGEVVVRGRGMGARERRLQIVREEKRRREREAAAKYPDWARIIEHACKNDMELREIIGDSIGNPEEMRKRIEERVKAKGRDILQPRTGSALPLRVSFRNFDPQNSYIWLELHGAPSDKNVEIIGSVFRSWYMLGRLGGFNSLNLQLTKAHLNARWNYNNDAERPLPCLFHNIGDLEFQDNLGRLWVDLGTSDALALDILINALSIMSLDHTGIKHLIFGGSRFGDWEEGMTIEEDGYKVYKI